jgi:hypothetical protein
MTPLLNEEWNPQHLGPSTWLIYPLSNGKFIEIGVQAKTLFISTKVVYQFGYWTSYRSDAIYMGQWKTQEELNEVLHNPEGWAVLTLI